MWKVSHKGFPTFDILQVRNIINNNLCSICHPHPELVQYCLFECVLAKKTWSIMCCHQNTNSNNISNDPYNNVSITYAKFSISQYGPSNNHQQQQMEMTSRSTSATLIQVPQNFNDFIKLSVRKDTLTLCFFALQNLWLVKNARAYRKSVQTPQQTFQITLVLCQEYQWVKRHKLTVHGTQIQAHHNMLTDKIQQIKVQSG